MRVRLVYLRFQVRRFHVLESLLRVSFRYLGHRLAEICCEADHKVFTWTINGD